MEYIFTVKSHSEIRKRCPSLHNWIWYN